MTLIDQLRQDKLTLIAMNALITEYAAELETSLAGSLSAQCQAAGVNRTQLYQSKAQLERALSHLTLPGRGRPSAVSPDPVSPSWDCERGWGLRERVLRYQLEHPGAVVAHGPTTTGYSDGFRRFVLDLSDEWGAALEAFSILVEVPYPTLASWLRRDTDQPSVAQPARALPPLASSASEACRTIVEDYAVWPGSLRDFLRYEARRLNLAPTAIRRVLRITGMVAVRPKKLPRYRGSTVAVEPGAILVTDGKTLEVVSTASGELNQYNWQAMLDQPSACHTATVLTETECAAGVRQAFDDSCEFLGRPPQALIHDGKPIHDDAALRAHIEVTTRMIPATPGRGQNKAVVEGEFGKFEQTVGTVYLDDTSPETLKMSALSEALRAYTTAINHAGRAELRGKSRLEVLRDSRPDPALDRAFIEQLHAAHTGDRPPHALPTRPVARQLLDQAFARFELQAHDPQGQLRHWLSARFTPAAIRQGLALFATQRDKGRLRNPTAHRYLVKLIHSAQEELDLRRQEQLLLDFARTERDIWLQTFEVDFTHLETQCQNDHTADNDLAFRLSEHALFGSLFLERAFWEDKLCALLDQQRHRIRAVCRHIRRMYETNVHDRFQLISRVLSWEAKLCLT
jgi:hypothetical protein